MLGSETLVYAGNARQKVGEVTSYFRTPGMSLLDWQKSRIVSALGGPAAMEQKFGLPDIGCSSDLDHAFDKVRELLSDTCINGFSFYSRGYSESEHLKASLEQAVAAEVERYYRKAKEIISANREFFEKLAAALAEKKLLSAVDIQQIREDCRIVSVAI